MGGRLDLPRRRHLGPAGGPGRLGVSSHLRDHARPGVRHHRRGRGGAGPVGRGGRGRRRRGRSRGRSRGAARLGRGDLGQWAGSLRGGGGRRGAAPGALTVGLSCNAGRPPVRRRRPRAGGHRGARGDHRVHPPEGGDGAEARAQHDLDHHDGPERTDLREPHGRDVSRPTPSSPTAPPASSATSPERVFNEARAVLEAADLELKTAVIMIERDRGGRPGPHHPGRLRKPPGQRPAPCLTALLAAAVPGVASAAVALVAVDGVPVAVASAGELVRYADAGRDPRSRTASRFGGQRLRPGVADETVHDGGGVVAGRRRFCWGWTSLWRPGCPPVTARGPRSPSGTC